MLIVFNVTMVLIAFVFMEGVAWFTHKYVMHGFLWSWHKSHHEPRKGKFEMNDLFGIIFAIISATLIITGSSDGLDWKFYFGFGIFLYGLAYFLVHDIFVHQRIQALKKSKYTYFKAMRFAHKVHHKVNTKDGAEAFGFLFVSKKYLDKYRKQS